MYGGMVWSPLAVSPAEQTTGAPSGNETGDDHFRRLASSDPAAFLEHPIVNVAPPASFFGNISFLSTEAVSCFGAGENSCTTLDLLHGKDAPHWPYAEYHHHTNLGGPEVSIVERLIDAHLDSGILGDYSSSEKIFQKLMMHGMDSNVGPVGVPEFPQHAPGFGKLGMAAMKEVMEISTQAAWTTATDLGLPVCCNKVKGLSW